MTRDSFTIEQDAPASARTFHPTEADALTGWTSRTASDLADAACERELAGYEREARMLWAGAVTYATTAHAANLQALGVR